MNVDYDIFCETYEDRLAELIAAARSFDELTGPGRYYMSAAKRANVRRVGYSDTSLAECLCHTFGKWPTVEESPIVTGIMADRGDNAHDMFKAHQQMKQNMEDES